MHRIQQKGCSHLLINTLFTAIQLWLISCCRLTDC